MMKRKNFVLLFATLFVGVLSFGGCSTQKNYNMSYEQVISLLENQSKEMMELFFNLDAQEKDLNLCTKLNTDQLNLDLILQSQSRIDYDSKVQDVDMSFVADVKASESELDFTTSGAVNYSLIGDDIYLKLSKFSLKGPSAKDLAMVNMVVNGFKGQRFKLGMTGMSMSHTFGLYDLYSERLGEIVDNAGKAMINQGSGIYDGIFDEYKGYNAWKYSVDEEKFDEMLHMYVDMMNEFYSGLLAQYAAQNLGTQDVGLVDFNDVLSGITYDNLQGYFVIVGKNEVVETMEGAHMVVDGTGIVFNYYYGKDGLYLVAKSEDGEDFMSIIAKRNGRTYNVYANLSSMMSIKGDVKFNKFSKKDGIDANFDLNISINTEGLGDSDESVKQINVDIPLKGNYRVKSVDNFTLQAPSDAIDLMDMVGDYLGASMGGDDYREDNESEYLDGEGYEVVGAPEIVEESEE